MDKYVVSYGNHPSQFGELRMPDDLGPSPVIVVIHGGFWQAKYDLYENDPICDDLTARGFATWNIEYRRVGEEGGGWPGTCHDVMAAVNHLSVIEQSYSIDLANVIIIGHSAGGHLGLWLASRTKGVQKEEPFTELVIPIQKVISLAGVTDLKQMWDTHNKMGIRSPVAGFMGGSPTEVAKRYEMSSPIELLPKNIEQVLIHGALDRHVPVQQSKDYFHKLKKAGGNVRLTVLEDVEHFKIIDPESTAWQSVVHSI